jgi:hypothetical protein
MLVNGGDVRRSVDACLGFTQAAMQYYCATGVYMEKILTGPPPVTRPPSRLYPCDQQPLFPAACYRYKAVELLDRFGSSARLTHTCLQLKAQERRGCFHGLGHAATAIVAKHPTQLARLCRHGNHSDQIVCVEGAIEKLAEYDEKRARAACSSLKGDLRTVCEQAETNKMYSLTKATFALYYDEERVAQRKLAVAAAQSAGVASTQPDHPH